MSPETPESLASVHADRVRRWTATLHRTARVGTPTPRIGSRRVGSGGRTSACAGVHWDVPEDELHLLPMFQREFGIPFPLVHGDAERAPFRDASFDLAVSEYGAIIWCDPHRWIPEAARILRPGGRLVCLGNSYLLMLTFPNDGEKATESLQRPHFGMHRFVDANNTAASVEFHIPHGEMIRLFRRSGFEIENLIEIGAPSAGSDVPYRMATVRWAQRWPNEQAWVVRKQ